MRFSLDGELVQAVMRDDAAVVKSTLDSGTIHIDAVDGGWVRSILIIFLFCVSAVHMLKASIFIMLVFPVYACVKTNILFCIWVYRV